MQRGKKKSKFPRQPQPDDAASMEKVTKLEAANKQMRSAVWLFFFRKDLVSCLALAAGAHEILRALCIKKGLEASLLKDYERLHPDFKEEWGGILNESPNFFKHGSRDPDATHSFPKVIVETMIYDCISMHGRLNGTPSHEAQIFETWFLLKNTSVLVHPEGKRLYESAKAKGLNPADFKIFQSLLTERADKEIVSI